MLHSIWIIVVLHYSSGDYIYLDVVLYLNCRCAALLCVLRDTTFVLMLYRIWIVVVLHYCMCFGRLHLSWCCIVSELSLCCIALCASGDYICLGVVSYLNCRCAALLCVLRETTSVLMLYRIWIVVVLHCFVCFGRLHLSWCCIVSELSLCITLSASGDYICLDVVSYLNCRCAALLCVLRETTFVLMLYRIWIVVVLHYFVSFWRLHLSWCCIVSELSLCCIALCASGDYICLDVVSYLNCRCALLYVLRETTSVLMLYRIWIVVVLHYFVCFGRLHLSWCCIVSEISLCCIALCASGDYICLDVVSYLNCRCALLYVLRETTFVLMLYCIWIVVVLHYFVSFGRLHLSWCCIVSELSLCCIALCASGDYICLDVVSYLNCRCAALLCVLRETTFVLMLYRIWIVVVLHYFVSFGRLHLSWCCIVSELSLCCIALCASGDYICLDVVSYLNCRCAALLCELRETTSVLMLYRIWIVVVLHYFVCFGRLHLSWCCIVSEISLCCIALCASGDYICLDVVLYLKYRCAALLCVLRETTFVLMLYRIWIVVVLHCFVCFRRLHLSWCCIVSELSLCCIALCASADYICLDVVLYLKYRCAALLYVLGKTRLVFVLYYIMCVRKIYICPILILMFEETTFICMLHCICTVLFVVLITCILLATCHSYKRSTQTSYSHVADRGCFIGDCR